MRCPHMPPCSYVTKYGGKIVKSVTKAVTHLVNDHGEVGPSKLAKCKKNGVPIVGEDVILELVRQLRHHFKPRCFARFRTNAVTAVPCPVVGLHRALLEASC